MSVIHHFQLSAQFNEENANDKENLWEVMESDSEAEYVELDLRIRHKSTRWWKETKKKVFPDVF